MDPFNNASIAYALTSLVTSVGDNSGSGVISAAVLSRAPGDGAQKILRDLASALGLKMIDIRVPHLDKDRAIDAVCLNIKEGLAENAPMFLMLNDAHAAENGILADLCSWLSSNIGNGCCYILAISTSAGERQVSESLAEGLSLSPSEILTYRTANENVRLLNKVVEAFE